MFFPIETDRHAFDNAVRAVAMPMVVKAEHGKLIVRDKITLHAEHGIVLNALRIVQVAIEGRTMRFRLAAAARRSKSKVATIVVAIPVKGASGLLPGLNTSTVVSRQGIPTFF
jgi:hypothetical protein